MNTNNEAGLGNGGLSDEQKARLVECEKVIVQGQQAFILTALAFYEIFADKLFKPEFTSFADYCKARWEMDDTMSLRYRQAGEVLTHLKDEAKKPSNEGQCRELKNLGKEDCVAIWQRIVKAADKSGKTITAGMIAKEVEKAAKKDDGEKNVSFVAQTTDQTTGPKYLVKLTVEKPHSELKRVFKTEQKDLVYSVIVPNEDATKILLKMGTWFEKNAEKYGLVEFSLSVAK